MFQSLRQGSLFYILDKGENPKLRVGQVTAVSQPQPRYQTSFPNVGNGFDTIVDVSVKVDGEPLEFKALPASLSIANFGQNGVVVSESKEAMSAEVEAMLRTSQQAIDSIPYHQRVLATCDGILRELNPQFAKEKEQEEKIGSLEAKMIGVEDTLSEIKDLLSKALKKDKV
jgi:hypothetical protein